MPRSVAPARQDLALADMVGGADDPLGFHPLDDPRGAVVADLQMTLDKAGRSLALAAYHGHGLLIERITRFSVHLAACRIEGRAVVLGDLVDVVGLAVRLQRGHDALHL